MSITHIPWNRDGLCGPACVQMVLHDRRVTGTSEADQETVWTSIKDLTHGTGTQQCCAEVQEPFPKMKRENCAGQGCAFCWETFPTALKAALVARLAMVQGPPTISLRRPGNQDTANNRIQNCLTRGGVPIVLVRGGQHWLIVDDWGATSVGILDPAGYGPETISMSRWNDNMMVAVDCGTYDGKYVIVEVG